MRILTFSSLFPNSVDPTHGIFVARRLTRLLQDSGISATVVAPVPWFPSRAGVFGHWADMARIERRRDDQHFTVHYPRYPVIPKLGMSVAARLMAWFCGPAVRRIVAESGPFDLIDAHYFYPDGVAASIIAREVGLPYVVTARGSDVNLIAGYAGPRRQILRAAAGANRVIAVSQALADQMESIGIDGEKTTVIRNGVDMDSFSPGDEQEARRKLGLGEKVMLYVGALKSAKGQARAIRLAASEEDSELVIVGKGPEDRRYRRLADELGAAQRVRFTGSLSAEDLRDYYRAASATLLLSKREGMPNVVLESLACGTPVVGSDVGGIPELVREPVAGCLVRTEEDAELEDAWRQVSGQPKDSAAIRQYANRFSWDDSIDRLRRVLEDAASGGAMPLPSATA